MATKSEWRVRLLMILGSLGIGCILLGLGGEAAVRYRERHRESNPGTMPFLFYRHQRYSHALVRGADYFGWIHTNPQGFRGTVPVLEEKGSAFRVMVVGGSTTFDSFVRRDEDTWPARLGHWLNIQRPDRVEVINAGVPGYRIIDNLIRLETELYLYRPDLLILYHAHNDIGNALAVGPPAARSGDATFDPRPNEAEPVSPWRHWLEQHSLFYAKALSRIQVLRWKRDRVAAGGGGGESVDFERVVEEGRSRFERDLRSFLVVARSMGIEVVLVEVVQSVPSTGPIASDSTASIRWQTTLPGVPLEVVLSAYREYNATLARVAGEYRLPFIPTAGFMLSGPEWYSSGDPIHFNSDGAERMAREMAREVEKLGLVPPLQSDNVSGDSGADAGSAHRNVVEEHGS